MTRYDDARQAQQRLDELGAEIARARRDLAEQLPIADEHTFEQTGRIDDEQPVDDAIVPPG